MALGRLGQATGTGSKIGAEIPWLGCHPKNWSPWLTNDKGLVVLEYIFIHPRLRVWFSSYLATYWYEGLSIQLTFWGLSFPLQCFNYQKVPVGFRTAPRVLAITESIWVGLQKQIQQHSNKPPIRSLFRDYNYKILWASRGQDWRVNPTQFIVFRYSLTKWEGVNSVYNTTILPCNPILVGCIPHSSPYKWVNPIDRPPIFGIIIIPTLFP